MIKPFLPLFSTFSKSIGSKGKTKTAPLGEHAAADTNNDGDKRKLAFKTEKNQRKLDS